MIRERIVTISDDIDCSLCECTIQEGEQAFQPRNYPNRWKLVCQDCIETLVNGALKKMEEELVG